MRHEHRALCQHNSKKNSRKYVKISKINTSELGTMDNLRYRIGRQGRLVFNGLTRVHIH